jgi:hypothetical protein
MLDTRIKILNAKIQNAEIMKVSTSNIGIGSRIVARISGQTKTFVLGDQDFRKITDFPVFSDQTPLV